jgi:chromatin structure-remodeling complex subunit RSC1/2
MPSLPARKAKYSKQVRTPCQIRFGLCTYQYYITGHFADHPVEDIIEKIACQFTARHIRGRPRPPFWYPGFPLYVCDSRYNDLERVFVRIKNWNSCVPKEVRQKEEFLPIYPFERTVYPVKVPSPFLVKSTSTKPAVKRPRGFMRGPNNDQTEGPQDGKRQHQAAR